MKESAASEDCHLETPGAAAASTLDTPCTFGGRILGGRHDSEAMRKHTFQRLARTNPGTRAAAGGHEGGCEPVELLLSSAQQVLDSPASTSRSQRHTAQGGKHGRAQRTGAANKGSGAKDRAFHPRPQARVAQREKDSRGTQAAGRGSGARTRCRSSPASCALETLGRRSAGCRPACRAPWCVRLAGTRDTGSAPAGVWGRRPPSDCAPGVDAAQNTRYRHTRPRAPKSPRTQAATASVISLCMCTCRPGSTQLVPAPASAAPSAGAPPPFSNSCCNTAVWVCPRTRAAHERRQ